MTGPDGELINVEDVEDGVADVIDRVNKRLDDERG